ncbi:MAG TPA: UDP-N-acetylglucosamine 2-epimerase (non-hydrolyzing) [Jatrophihabitans sp.]|jgi:UDP-N-acetylglucosamine 2-epimerase (non-hydrolysing)|nr:UDP-N-acetylglucosamine 2-epimerase (non-hydrolyzing) [Jatrophihabitans sp.]
MERSVALVVGTRPEAVKIAPLVPALLGAGLEPLVIDTGQQPGRVAEALAPFGLACDASLGLQRLDGGLNELIALAISAVDGYLRAHRPAAVLVQGDTSTAMAVGLAAAMLSIPVVHLEAGLRTGDRRQPFPEETNRTLLADLADLHLAPTPMAARALAGEGRAGDTVVVTGNTVVDALQVLLPQIVDRPLVDAISYSGGGSLLAVTVHRREAWGEGVRAVAGAVRTLLDQHPDLHAAVVTHPNPAVAADVRDVLTGVGRCDLLAPLPYDDMLALLYRADVSLTDSGGIQEEAPTLRLPVVVARSVTERPEGIEAGWATLVGLDADAMVKAVSDRLVNRTLPAASGNPYGDGQASERCAQAIGWLLGLAARPADWVPGS